MQHLQPKTTLQGGKYRIERVLGQGGFGITYLARNTMFDIDVAIKEFFMKDENDRDGSSVTMPNTTKQELFHGQMEKFKKEAKRMFAIKNEHIIGVQDLFEENGTAYYVMDFVDGENLSERLKRTGRPMTESEVRLILPQILDALKAVHEAGIWHLDLKPANIMVDKSGNVKLIDFGASKQFNAQKGGATTSTAISYTNGYAPREQMEQNYDKFGPWTDIYALGATLYNLLTNKRPPLPTDIDDDISEDKHTALPFPESVGGLRFLVLQMMKTNRLQRPQNIDAIDIKTKREQTLASDSRYSQNSHWVESPWSTDDEDEETIMANPQPKKEEKDEKAKPEPRPTVNPKTTQNTHTYTPLENNDKENSGKGVIIFMIVAFVIVVIILANYGTCNNANNNQLTAVGSNQQKVENMQYETAIGSCSYSGPVDENNRPHGRGEAKFIGGNYYKGGFRHGTLEGDQCYYETSDKDFFFGTFRNNSFYIGKYTYHKDGSYFDGCYSKMSPYSGAFYDKKGKLIKYWKPIKH